MGLRKLAGAGPTGLAVRMGHWILPLSIALICVAFEVFGDAGRAVGRYDRLAIADGEWWRLVTGHFTHLGWPHLAMNMAGLVLVWLLVGRHCSVSRWLAILGVSVAAVSGGFWFFDENMYWYVGFSGVLHGLIVAGALAGLAMLPGESLVVLVIVAGKLAWEQAVGPLPGSESTAGGDVAVDAHLFGAIGGLAVGLAIRRGGGSGRSI